MSWIAAVLVVVGGLGGLAATWNAARPALDPTKRYSPAWLPAMVVSELAPTWLAIHVGVLVAGLALGAWELPAGQVGIVLIALSSLGLCWVIGRSLRAVRGLRRSIDGVVHPARGTARFIGRPVPTPPGVVEQHGVVWAEGLTLDLVRPASRRRHGPVLVYVHGGGWTGGDPQAQARDLYHTLALDGWTTMAIRYPFTPLVTVEEQIDTVRAAIRWSRAGLPTVADHGLEPTTVAVAGGSAGAHLASMAALVAAHDDERVAACVGFYGVYDMANRNRTRAHWTKIRREVMLASVDDAPARYRAVSPLDRIGPDSPPMLIVHGARDTLVPIGEGEQFAAALRAAGRPVDFVAVGGAEHAYDALSSITSRTSAAMVRDWLRRTVLAPGSAPFDARGGQAPTA